MTIFTGISPHGQGQETTFAQLAADYIGADFDKVIVHHGDTGNTAHGNGTGGSRGLAVGGAALVLSLDKIREKAMRDRRAQAGGGRRGHRAGRRQVPRQRRARRRASPWPRSRRSPTAAACRRTSTPGWNRPTSSNRPTRPSRSARTSPWSRSSRRRARCKLLRYISVDDCGNIISPMLVTGQVHGGLAQGIGLALWEEVLYDDSGELLTGTLNDYAMPKARRFPRLRDASHHDDRRPSTRSARRASARRRRSAPPRPRPTP